MAHLEDLAEHLSDISSAWQLDIALVRNGINDACRRIQKLEAEIKKMPRPKI